MEGHDNIRKKIQKARDECDKILPDIEKIPTEIANLLECDLTTEQKEKLKNVGRRAGQILDPWGLKKKKAQNNLLPKQNPRKTSLPSVNSFEKYIPIIINNAGREAGSFLGGAVEGIGNAFGFFKALGN